MKICQSCRTPFEGPKWICPGCLWKPKQKDGFPLLTFPDKYEYSGFVPEYFKELESFESGHFWFRGRNRLVLWAAKRYFPLAGSILDLGCGTGLILKGIERLYPNASVYGGDLFPEALVLASKRLERTSLFLTDISALPFEREFDLIGIFDVLEHIEEDEAVLREINRALVPGGGLMVTVPQHPYLWSRQDEHSLHVRRYRAEELNAKMLNCGFRIISETSFVSMLLPFLALSRFLKGRMRQLPFSKCEKNDPMAELKIPRWLNRLLDKVMSVELSIIEGGGRFHAGGSLFVAAVKKEETGPGRQGVDTKYEIREGSAKSPRSN